MTVLERKRVGHRMSQTVIAGDLIFLAGQVPPDPRGKSCPEQAKQVLTQIDELLAEAGSDKSRIVSATIFLTHMSDFDAFNSVWDSWVVEGSPPARACLEARLARQEWLVEVSIVAAR